MATAGTVTIKLDGDSASLVRELNKAQKKTKSSFGSMKKQAGKMAKGLALVGGAAVAAFAVVVKQSFKSIDALAKLSDQLGISTKALAGLQLAAKITGTDQNSLNKALIKQQKAISDANRGLLTYTAQFDKLGINTEKLARLSVDEQFMEIADALDKVESRTEQTSIAYDLWGGRATTLLNTIKGGRTSLEAFADEADRLGIAVSRVDAAQIEAANDAFTRTRSAVEGVGNQVAVAIAPLTKVVADAMTQWLLDLNEGKGKMQGVLDVSAVVIAGLVNGANLIRGAWLGIKLAIDTTILAFQEATGIAEEAMRPYAKEIEGIQDLLAQARLEASGGFLFGAKASELELAHIKQLESELATLLEMQSNAEASGVLGGADSLAPLRATIAATTEEIETLGVVTGEAIKNQISGIIAGAKVDAPEGTLSGDTGGDEDVGLGALLKTPEQMVAAWQLANEQRLEMDAALKDTMYATEQEFSDQMIVLAGEQARARVMAELEAKGEALSETGEIIDPLARVEAEKKIGDETNRQLKKSLGQRLKLEGDFGKNYKKLTSITSLFVGKAWSKQQAGTLKRTATFATAFSSIANTLFGDSKIMAIANATISTLTGVAKALELPYPANIAAAAQVAATGFAQVSSIKSTSPGGGAEAPSVGGASSLSTVSDAIAVAGAPDDPNDEDEDDSARHMQTVQVFFEGPILADDESTQLFIEESIRGAIADRDVVIINGDSRQAQEIRAG